MTQDEIIAMATEAGWTGIYTQWAEPTGKPDWTPFKYSLTVPVTMEQIQRFAALVAAKEREACALVCESERVEYMELSAKNNGRESDFAFGSVNSAERIAAAIRARGTKEGA